MVKCLFGLFLLLWSADISSNSTKPIIDLQCASPETKSFKLTIISSRNKKGHWTAQVWKLYKITKHLRYKAYHITYRCKLLPTVFHYIFLYIKYKNISNKFYSLMLFIFMWPRNIFHLILF